MPGQVTGTIGQEDVRLENAATESTLQMLVATMEKLAKAQGIKGRDYDKELNYLKKKQPIDEKNLKNTEKQNKNLESVNKNLESFGNALGRTADALGRMSSFAINGLAKVFSDSTPTIEGALSQIPLVGGALGTLGGIVDRNIKTFRDLGAVGIDLGDSIYSAQMAAARAGVPLETFAKVVAANSETMARFGGTAGEGAQKFANIVGKLDRRELARLGMTMDEITEQTASYLEIQSRSGKLSSMSQAELTKGAQAYNQELDKLSRATGLSRKQLDEANQAAARDARMRTALSKLEPEERARVLARIKQLEEAGATEAAEGLKDIIATGGVAVTENARNLVLTNKEFADAGAAIAKGQKGSADQLDNTLRNTAKSAQNMSDGQARLATTMATMGVTTPMYMAKTMESFTNAGEDIKKATEEQNKAKASEAKKIAEADQQLTEMVNKLKVALLPVLDAFGKLLLAILPPITTMINFFTGLPGTVQAAMLGVAAAIYLAFKVGLIGKMNADMGGGGAPSGGGASGGKGGGGKFGRLATGLKGVGIGSIAGAGLGLAADAMGTDTTGGGLASAGSTAAQWAGYGMFLGPKGALIGGALGGAYGLWENRSAIFGAPKPPTESTTSTPAGSTPTPVAAATPTTKPEDPMSALSSMNAKLDQLNTTMMSLLNVQARAAKDIAKTAQNTVYASGVVY